jgi:hypothetical protein
LDQARQTSSASSSLIERQFVKKPKLLVELDDRVEDHDIAGADG